MVDWGKSDPDFDATKSKPRSAKFGLSDPDYEIGVPTPVTRRETFPEEKPTFTEALIGRGEPPKTSIALGGANIPTPAPVPPTEEELAKAALSGRTVEQMRAGAAAEEIPQTGDLRPITGREGTQATYNRIYDLLGGILTPEQSAAAKEERVAPLREAADMASAAVPLAREKQERAMQFKDEAGVPLIDKVTQLMQIRDTTTDPQEQIRAQSQIRDIVRNAPVEFRNLLVDLEDQLKERAIAARAAEVEARNAPAPTQTFARSAIETAGQTAGSQVANTISAAQRVVLSPISLIEAVTGQPPNMSREIDKQAKSISDALTGEFKPDEAQMNDLGMKVVSGLTSTGMFAATGPVGAGLRLSRPVSIAIAGALPEAEQGWQEAKRRAEEDPTLDQEWTRWWSFTNRAITGGSEAIPISRLFSRLENASGGSLTRAIGIVTANAGEEALQQFGQDILNNANSVYLLKDPNATITKDVADNMIVAGLTGALFAGGAVSAKAIADMRDVYKTPEQAPVNLRDILFPKDPAQNEAEAETAVTEEPGATETPAATLPEEDLNDIAVLKGAGRDFDDILMMSKRQRQAEAKALREEEGIEPVPLTEEEIRYFLPEEEAPAVPSSPEQAVEARGPEGVLPSPSAPPAAPSEIATGLVQQGVPPLEAMQQAAEQRQAAGATMPTPAPTVPTPAPTVPSAAPVVEPLPSVTPVAEPEPVAKAPKAAVPAKPVPFSAPEAKKAIDTASTGKPFKAKLIRGQGAGESPYNAMGAQEPILGEGLYTTHDQEYASSFGPNITEHEVNLKNPLVIESDTQWRNLTKRAGWALPNPIGGDKQQISKDIANLRKMLVDQGHDGVVVLVPEDEMRGKTLQNVFGADQVVEFNAKKPEAPKAAKAEKPAKQPKAKAVEAPAIQMESVKGNTYGSMNAARFVAMVTLNPQVSREVKSKSFAEAGNGKIKVRLDPSVILPAGSDVAETLNSVRSAVKEVIVGDGAYKGLSEKKARELNDALAKIEAAGGKVTLEGEPPTFSKKKRSRPVGELGSFIAAEGGINGYNKKTGKPSQEFQRIAERRVPGLIRKNGGMDLWDAVQAATIAGYYPEWRGSINQTRRYDDDSQNEKIQTLLDDLEAGGVYLNGVRKKGKRREEVLEEQEDFYAEIAAGLRGDLRVAGIVEHPDVFNLAVNLLARGDVANGYEAYELAALEVAMEDPSVLEPVIHDITGEDYWSTVAEQRRDAEGEAIPVEQERMEDDFVYETEPSPAPETGAIRGEGVEREERPAAKAEPEGSGKGVQEPSGGKAEKPVEEAPVDEQEILDRVQKMLDARLRPGYRVAPSVRPADKGKGVLIYSPGLKTPSFHLIEDIPAWIKGVIRVVPEEAAKPKEGITFVSKKRINLGPVDGFITRLTLSNGKEIDIYHQKGDGGMQLNGWHYVNNADQGPVTGKGWEAYRVGYIADNLEQAIANVVERQNQLAKEAAPVEEKGAEGKPQLVVPGAEKISDKELAERKAAAPMKAKVEQKEVGGLFGDERLQKDIFDSVKSKPEAPVVEKQEAPKQPELPDWIKTVAKKNNAKPVFANDTVGLVVSTDNGLGYFGVTKTGFVSGFDVSHYTGKDLGIFTADELKILQEERKNAVRRDAEMFSENPDGPFAKSDIVVTENFPKELGKIAAEWTKLANLPKETRIMFATPEDAYNLDLAGDFRFINTSGSNLKQQVGIKFSVQKTSTGEYLFHVIYMKDKIPKFKALETISHELGHIIEVEAFKNAPAAVRSAILQAHRDWQDARKKENKLSSLIKGRAYRSQVYWKRLHAPDLDVPLDIVSQKDINYYLSFKEWFADQTARWYNSQAKPLGVVERFFKRLADALRRFYASTKGQEFVPDAEFKKWFDGHIESNRQTISNQIERIERVIVDEQRETLDRSNTPTYTVPKDGFGAQFLYGLVDKYMDGTRIQKAIEAARGSKLPDNLDIEMAIQLMQDKAIAKQQKFYDKDVRPMVAFMQAHKITGDEAGRFFYAQHAPERNARMAQRDPSRFDGTNGSGLTTQEALDYLASIPAERRALLETLYNKHLKPILRADLEYRVNNGLLTDEQYDAYTKPFNEGGYDFYVPLQGYAEEGSDNDVVEADPFIPNIGKGFAVWGKEYKLAAGRTSKAMNPLYSAIQKRMDGIVRAEKNKTDKVLWDLLRKYPNPEIATLHTDKDLPTRKVLRADGTIQSVPDFAMAKAEETLPLKIGGRQAYIIFNRDNATSKRLASALKGMVGEEVGIMGRTLLATGRFMSNINTQWVPDFFITNMPRDVQDALISIYSTKEGFATNFVKEFMRSGNIVRKVAMGQKLSAEEQIHYDEWIQSGGRLDFGGFATIEKTSEKLQKEFGDLFDAGRTDMDTLKRYFQKSGDLTLGAIERFNQLFDDVVRFSVYRAARRDPSNRFSKDRAAQLARRATVDFRQRGAKMPYLNALYPYLSAGINGQRNFIRVLKSRRGRMALSTLILLGISNSLLGVALSEDDETDPTKKKFYTQVSDWERAKSFIIPIPINGKYRKISLGFMGLFAFGLGDQIVGYMTGNVKAGDAAINVSKSLASSFIPFWSGGAVDSITPWVLQAPIELYYNKNWLGNPIYPDRDTRMPQSSQAFASTPDWAKAAAEFANEWTNGSETKAGWVDVYPATLDYFAKFMTQGLGTFASSSYESFRAFMDGEDLEAEKLPFLRRTTVKDTADRTEYYETRNSIKAGVAQARELRKIIMDPKASQEDKADARDTMRNLTKELGITLDADGVRVKNSVADIFDKTDDRIKKLNDEIDAIQKSEKYTTLEKSEKIKAKEETKKSIMNSARKRYIQKNKPSPAPLDELKGILE